MHRRRNHARAWLAGVAAVIAVSVCAPAPAAASGGGGCGRPVTDEAGTAVEMRDSCFAPTILRAPVGADVTLTNRDGVPHTVLGANGAWGGYDILRRGRDITFRFVEPGVYPYVCTYHVGMVGTVVVGDGVGGAIDTVTAEGPVVRVESPAPEATRSEAAGGATGVLDTGTSVGTASGGRSWPAYAVGGVGASILAGAFVVVRRRRRRSTTD